MRAALDTETARPTRSKAAKNKKARARLLDAATVLFAEKGYASTSVGEIVAKARVTKPVLYYYFESKEGIFQAILAEAFRLQEELLAEALREDGTVRGRILRLFRRIYDEVTERPHLFRILHILAFSPPQGTPYVDLESFHGRFIDALRAMVEEAQARGEVPQGDSMDAALLLLSALSLCLDMDLCYPARADAERLPRLLELAFGGLKWKTEEP
jgi:AcrR family transcriptional regulator